MSYNFKRIFFSLFLLIGFVLPTLSQNNVLQDGYYRIVSHKNKMPILVKNHQLGYVSEHSGGDSKTSQFWKVKRINGTYWMVSVSDQLAIQSLDELNKTFTVGTNPGKYYIKPATGNDAADYWVISTNENFEGKTLWHNGGSGLVQNWEGLTNENNFWKFEPLTGEDLTTAQQLESSWAKLEKGFTALNTFRNGGLYRVKGKSNRYWTTDASSHALKTTDQASSTDFASVWFVERNGDGFALRNALTGRFLPNATANQNVALAQTNNQVWFDFKKTSDDYYHISASYSFNNGECFVEADNHNIVGGNAMSFTTKQNEAQHRTDTTFFLNTTSEWEFQPANDVSIESIKELLRKNSHGVYEPAEGKYYIIRNVAYPNRVLTTYPHLDNVLRTEARNEREMGQVWTLKKVNDKWALCNVVNNEYVGNSTPRSESFKMVSTPAPFTLQSMDQLLPNFAFVVSEGVSLHSANSKGFEVVNWNENTIASQWQLEEVNLDNKALTEYKQKLEDRKRLNADYAQLNEKLQQFFEDYACTQLKANYKTMGEEAFKAALYAQDLPQSLIEMALRVKADVWNKQSADANKYEKYFRIQEYQAYSHPQKWANNNKLMPTNFGQYSQLTNPTGITIPEKELVLLFVNNDTPEKCFLQAELVQGKNKTGTTFDLHKGVNTIYANELSHLYINYMMDDVNLKYTELPKIRIHVEGGRANGYFDATKMKNEDWNKLRDLKQYGFFNDDVIRLKSKHTIHSLSLSGVEEQQKQGNWFYNGEDKGITGVLGKWDWVHELEQEYFRPEQFAGRFNCLMFSTDAAGLYAFPYGTFIGTVSTTFSYKEWAKGGQYDDGGNLWAVVHETGHHYQKLFNLARCLESSNNLWSNIALWKRGASVSRLQAPQKLFNRFNNKNYSWLDMDLGDRTRMYWQLWLYYVELKHKPDFFKDLFAKFRENPINFSNAKTDYLRFAQYCSEVAQEDLTEFFDFYGFFNKVGNNVTYKYNDDFYDKAYGSATINISQEDIDACKTAMAQFPKKNTNLIFIDERIRKTPATYEGHKEGEMRWGTIGGMDPGDNRVFGDVGHYEDFGTAEKAGTTAAPQSVLLDGRTVRIQGTGAVGYKVYDDKGKLVMVANANDFLIPEKLDLSKISIKVIGGSRNEVEVIKNGEVLPAYKKRFTFDNPANLTLSEGKTSPLGRYYIRRHEAVDGKFYYLTKDGHPTEQIENAGEFLVAASRFSGEYNIYSVGMQQWISYERNKNYWGDYSFYAQPNLFRWNKEMTQAQTWKIIHEDNYYKVALQHDSRVLWNWNGGPKSGTVVGFYNTPNDGGSRWDFVPADITTKYLALVKHADSIMVRDAAKAINTQAYHKEFRAHLAEEAKRTTATQDQFDLLKNQLAVWETWRSADSTLTADASRVNHAQKLLKEFKADIATTTLTSSTIQSNLDLLRQKMEAWKTWRSADSLVTADASRVVNAQNLLNEFKAKITEASLSTAFIDPSLSNTKAMLTAWPKWLKADAILQRDANKVNHSRTFYDAFKAKVVAANMNTAATESELTALNDRVTAWPVWRDADSLVQIKPYGNPLNTLFRNPFTELVKKDYNAQNQIQELKEFGRYFRMLVTADSIINLKNPGYPLTHFLENSGAEEWVLQPAAAEPKPDFRTWSAPIHSILIDWANWANDLSVHTDKDGYYMPEDGKFYRLRSYYDNRYITSLPAENVPVSLSKQVDNNTLWILQQDNTGKQYLAAASGEGYLCRMEGQNHGSLSNEPAELSFGTARHISVGRDKQQKIGTLYIRNNQLSLVAWTNNNAIGGHPGTEANPVWHDNNGIAGTSFYFDTVKEATFKVTTRAAKNGNYATLYLPFATILPQGLKAYSIKEIVPEKEVFIEPLEGNILPANTAVILSSQQAGEFELRPTTWHAPLTTTQLKGRNLVFKPSERDAGTQYYALTIDTDTNSFVFRRVANYIDIPRNRAFFTLPLGTPAPTVLSFREPEILSKVKGITEQPTAPNAVFNLAGQRINASSASGVVISQGQKIIIR